MWVVLAASASLLLVLGGIWVVDTAGSKVKIAVLGMPTCGSVRTPRRRS
jgi:hypothetical protein